MATSTPSDFSRNRAEMQHFLGSSTRLPTPVATTRTPAGHVLDWVPRNAQLDGEPLASPPPPPVTTAPGEQHPEHLATAELLLPGVPRGPEGTVPFRRPLIAAMSNSMSLAQRSKVKVPPPGGLLARSGFPGGAFPQESSNGVLPAAEKAAAPPAPNYTGHYYGNSGQTVTNYGGVGTLSCFTPAVSSSAHFSLIQIGCSNSQQGYYQTAEAGWQVYPDRFGGDYTPHLFTYFTTNGYSSEGDNVGGYNTEHQGWRQHDASYYPGMTFSPLSTVDGAQQAITVRYQLYQGNWWLNVQGVWVGYYPGSLYAKAPPGSSTPVTTNTLGDHADNIGFWGEIFDPDTTPPTTQMGSGQFSSAGFGWSAYMHNLQVQVDSAGTLNAYQGGSGSATNNALYTIDAEFSNGGSWGSFCYVGGPGAFSALPSGASAAHNQVGLTQTDVFAIDRKGQLFVSWVDGGGGWRGPQPIGGVGLFPASAPLAAGPQVGLTQTDVFAVNTSGTLTVMWASGGGNWNGPLAIGGAVFLPGAPVATSQQFGLNQTSVFAVNKSGALTVAWVSGGGNWSGPATISGANVFSPSTTVAACQQFSLTQIDVFAVDKTGAMAISWVDGGGAWNGPRTISPAGTFIAGSPLAAGQQIGLDQTDIFAVDVAGALTITWVEKSGVWQGPIRISPVGTFLQGAAVAASQQFGLTQTDVFAVDKTGTLTVTWVDGGGKWNGPIQIGPVGLALPSATISVCQQAGLSQTDVFLVDRNGDLNMFFASGGQAWKGPIHP